MNTTHAKKDGSLILDTAKLNRLLATNRDDVKQFFTKKDNGLADKFNSLIESLSGPSDPKKADSSLLTLNVKALQDKIDAANAKMGEMQTKLDNERNRITLQFYNMELAVSKLQNMLNALSSIDWITNWNNNDNNGNN